MSSQALIVAEMHKLTSRAQECESVKSTLVQAKESSLEGYASVTVLGCVADGGSVAIDDAKIAVVVATKGEHESSKSGKVNEALTFDLATMEEVFTITCNHEMKGSGPMDDTGGIEEQASVVVIPYKAEISLIESGTDGAMTMSLEGKCDETTEVLGIRIKIVVDKIDDLISSKVKESAEIEASLGELQKQLKAENAAQTESAKKESAKKGQASKSKAASSSTDVTASPKISFAQMAMQAGQIAIGVAFSSGSYLIFGGAATLIYFYGDYASI